MLAPLLLLWTAGCSEPAPPAQDPPATPGAPPGPTGPAPEGAAQPPAPAPPPADGAATPPGGAVPPSSRPTPAGFQVAAGAGVKVSGTVAYAGGRTGTLVIDFIEQPTDQPYPKLLHSLAVAAPGPFEVEVPKNAGRLVLVAYLDEDGNGPESEEARAPSTEVQVAEAAVSGVALTVSDTPDADAKKDDSQPPEGMPPMKPPLGDGKHN